MYQRKERDSMALTDYVIMPGVDYQAACDAIRAKTGRTDLIKSGELAKEMLEDYTHSGDKWGNKITTMADYAYTEMLFLRSVSLPYVTYIGKSAFYRCHNLESVDFPLATEILSSGFNECMSLKTVNLPNVTHLQINAFFNCYSLTELALPSAKLIFTNAFCQTNLTTLILEGSTMCELRNIYNQTMTKDDWFEGTPIGNGNGAIYVTDALVSQYKANVHWGLFANVIKPLSEYTATI
jgi:hypothetical protein